MPLFIADARDAHLILGIAAYKSVLTAVFVHRFRPDLNASRMADSARRLEMPPFPEDRFVEAVKEVENDSSEISDKGAER